MTTIGPIPTRDEEGNLHLYDTRQALPASQKGAGLQSLPGAPEKGRALRDIRFGYRFSQPVTSAGVRFLTDKDPRPDHPYRKRGENGWQAILARTTEDRNRPPNPISRATGINGVTVDGISAVRALSGAAKRPRRAG